MKKEWFYNELCRAYFLARKNKRATVSQQQFELLAPLYLATLADKIENRTYKPSRSIAFIIEKPVKREIFAAPFVDRVVHHFLFNMVGEWWDRRFIYDSYSCRVGKGTLLGIKRCYHYLMKVSQNGKKKTYVLKLDLEGYFMSLPREKLYERVCFGLERQFKDHKNELYKTVDYLWQEIIFDEPTWSVKIKGKRSDWDKLPRSKSLFYARTSCGIVIGNLTSQLLSNIYLDQLDRFVVLQLKMRNYGRYVDDLYIFSNEKQELHAAKAQIQEYLRSISLRLHQKKTYLQEVGHGLAFLGAVIYPWRLQIGKRTKINIRVAVLKVAAEKIGDFWGAVAHFRWKKLWQQFTTISLIFQAPDFAELCTTW